MFIECPSSIYKSITLLLLQCCLIKAGKYGRTSSTDFTQVVLSSAFVDKTAFLKTFFTCKERVVIVTAPRGFGKSTNLYMTKLFSSIIVDDDGQQVDRNSSTIHHFFSFLSIFNDTEFFYRHFAVYPVIHLEFKPDKKLTTYKEAYAFIKTKLHESYVDHKYLANSDRLNSDEREFVEKWSNYFTHQKRKFTEVYNAMELLSEYLHRHHKRKVLVLVDDYDGMILQILSYLNNKDFWLIVDLIVQNLAELAKSRYVGKSLITGISYIANGGFLSKQGIKLYPFLSDHKFTPYFGFTKSDISNILKRYSKPKCNGTLLWGSGYTTKDGADIYNCFATVKCIHTGVMKLVWPDRVHKNCIEVMFLLSGYPAVKILLANEAITVKEFDLVKIKKKRLEQLRQIYYAVKSVGKIHLLVTFLFELGYFTYAGKSKMKGMTRIKLINYDVINAIKKLN